MLCGLPVISLDAQELKVIKCPLIWLMVDGVVLQNPVCFGRSLMAKPLICSLCCPGKQHETMPSVAAGE